MLPGDDTECPVEKATRVREREKDDFPIGTSRRRRRRARPRAAYVIAEKCRFRGRPLSREQWRADSHRHPVNSRARASRINARAAKRRNDLQLLPRARRVRDARARLSLPRANKTLLPAPPSARRIHFSVSSRSVSPRPVYYRLLARRLRAMQRVQCNRARGVLVHRGSSDTHLSTRQSPVIFLSSRVTLRFALAARARGRAVLPSRVVAENRN